MLRLPPPIWTLAYLVTAIGVSYLAGWPKAPGLPLPWLATVLFIFGTALAVVAVRLFRREATELNPTATANRKLVTDGPFRLSRNPMYLALVIIALSVALWIGAWPMFLAPVAIFATVNWVHIPFEERSMRRQFGEAFDAYARKVRRWF
jgi:protein-S-isoprenylcysteine O-methyltransferase Ste14